MPIEFAILFLIAISASSLLVGFSFALKTRVSLRLVDRYFYFVLAVVAYGFVNWVGPLLISYFNQDSQSTNLKVIVLFIAFAVPLALLKLYLFTQLLLNILETSMSQIQRYAYAVVSGVTIIIVGFLIVDDLTQSNFEKAKLFLTLLGVLILVAHFFLLFYFLTKVDSAVSEPLKSSVKVFGWVYLIGYCAYSSPFYITYFIELEWYQTLSPYLFYALHLAPLWPFAQLIKRLEQINPESSVPHDKISAVITKYALSEREGTILSLLLQGNNNQAIADQLCISPNTVRNHVYNIYNKLAVKNRIQLQALCQG